MKTFDLSFSIDKEFYNQLLKLANDYPASVILLKYRIEHSQIILGEIGLQQRRNPVLQIGILNRELGWRFFSLWYLCRFFFWISP